jgi:hypothetical protein
MKYLITTPRHYGSGHEIAEFETTAELTAYPLENALPKDVFVARRLGLSLQVCDWIAPAAVAEIIPEVAIPECCCGCRESGIESAPEEVAA